MYSFKKIMIALDLTAMDQYILNYVEGLTHFIKAEKVYFINIQKKFDIDEEIRTAMGLDEGLPLDEYAEGEMRKTVEKNFPSFKEFNCEFEMVEGNGPTEILRWAKMKGIDLMMMGRKKELKGQGFIPQQLASKLNCSVLLVPEGYTKFKLNNVFVPVNFSGQAVLALEEAVIMQKKTPQSLHIFCHYIYELPLGFEKSGKSKDEFSTILKNNSMKKFIKLKHEIGVETAEFNFTHELLKDGNIAKEIVAKAKTFDTDLIIMGAQTKSLAAQLFLGNTTKKMIIHDGDIPLLIIKDKKTTFDFWDFFSKM